MADTDIEITDDSYYLFTCAELKAREVEFIDASRMESLINAANFSEFIRVLGETYYSKYTEDIESAGTLDGIIFSNYRDFLDYLLKRLKPEHQLIKTALFFEEYLHNIKVIMKSFILDKNLEDIFCSFLSNYEELMEAVKTNSFKEIDSFTADILIYMNNLLEENPGAENSRLMELALEKYYFKKSADEISQLKSPLINDFLKRYTDILNLKNIYRSKYLKQKIDFQDFLHEGGYLSIDYLKGFENESIDYMVKELELSDYSEIIIKGTQGLYTGNSFVSFEINEELYYLKYLNKVKYSVSNIEKIFQFFLRKKVELRNLNIIFSGVIYKTNKNSLRCKVGLGES